MNYKINDNITVIIPILDSTGIPIENKGVIKQIYYINDTIIRIIVYFSGVDREYMFESNGSDKTFNTTNLIVV